MKLGIFILHYNKIDITNDLCKTIPEDIVIDNGSEIPYSGPNKYYRIPRNIGVTKGWNEAIKHFYNDFDAFWMMNNDIVISRDSIERIKSIIADPNIKFITPSFNCWMDHCRNKNSNTVREVKAIEFTAPIIKREVFDSIGLWDEIFSMGWGVDFDFCYRATNAGIKMHFVVNNHILK